MLSKLKQGLLRTKDALVNKVTHVIKKAVVIDDEFYETLEETLLLSDVGMNTAAAITDRIRELYRAEKPEDRDTLVEMMRRVISELLCEGAAEEQPFPPGLNVVMVTGVNGSGKTTTIGKLAANFKADGKNVMLAACDTFRAAAVDQLEIWAGRADVPIVRQKEGTDPSAVMFDAIQSARAKNIDILIADTAGRLHTQVNLMEELKKIRRVATEKAGVDSFRSWLVLDSTIGQNSINQMKEFNEAIQVDGLIITKLDGTARGGIVLSIVNEWKIPILYVGVGEQVEDLMPFDATEFAAALLGENLDDHITEKEQPESQD
ncbi:signal recognition particle-docking protein FtsY [bacterium]